MSTFVLEIGTEELPARFLSNVEKELAERFTAGLEEAGYTFSLLDTCATPRRSVVIVEGLEDTQPGKTWVWGRPPAVLSLPRGSPPRPLWGLPRRLVSTFPLWAGRRPRKGNTFQG